MPEVRVHALSDSGHLIPPYRGSFVILDGDPLFCARLGAVIAQHGGRSCFTDGLAAFQEQVLGNRFGIALIDSEQASAVAFEAIDILSRNSPRTRIAVLTRQTTIDFVVRVMQRGAATVISKDQPLETLVADLIECFGRDQPAKKPTLVGDTLGIIGDSPAIQNVLSRIDRLRQVPSTVLITGESGTGKELVARALHQLSPRATHRFEAINCGAIPENLLESELFGYRRGAFTDAKADHKGMLEVCNGGTLFLDEVAELPLALQAKLLRVLQEKAFLPLGASVSVKTDARILAATNKNLQYEVSRGAFREDLYYRLAVLHIRIPPLRDRRADLSSLIDYYVHRFNKAFDRVVAPPSLELKARLVAYDWPGNIRELKNAIERGVVLSRDATLTLENMLEDELPPERSSASAEFALSADCYGKTLSDAKFEFERAYLDHLLKTTNGNISEMARVSGRYRADIYRLLIKHGFEWDNFRPEEK